MATHPSFLDIVTCVLLSEARRAISISASKHLFEQKLHPHNGNNAHGATGTSARCIITALDTEALDISVISVFRIVAYAPLLSSRASLSPIPPRLSTLLFHCPSSTLFLFTDVHGRMSSAYFRLEGSRELEASSNSNNNTSFLRKMCDVPCVIDNYAVNEIKCRFDLPSRRGYSFPPGIYEFRALHLLDSVYVHTRHARNLFESLQLYISSLVEAFGKKFNCGLFDA